MKRRAKARGPGDIPLAKVLVWFARGETLEMIAARLHAEPGDVAGAVEGLAHSLGAGREAEERPKRATVHADGGARGNPGEAGVGWVIESRGETLLEGGRYIGTATNNVAEYEAVLLALEKALELGVEEVDVALDSELVVRQIHGVYRVKDPKLVPRHARVRTLIERFSRCTVAHVPRKDNRRADELANRAIDEALRGVTSK